MRSQFYASPVEKGCLKLMKFSFVLLQGIEFIIRNQNRAPDLQRMFSGEDN